MAALADFIPTGDLTLQANFVKGYTITLGASTGGTISPDAQVSVVENATLENITATASTGFEFVNWTIVGAYTGTVALSEMVLSGVIPSENLTITANFIVKRYSLT